MRHNRSTLTSSHHPHKVPYVRLSAWYFFYFAIVGTISPFWTLYLDSLSFNASQIGWVTAAVFATKIIAPNVWARVGDVYGRMPVVRVGGVLGVLCFLPIFIVSDFVSVLVISLMFSFFWNAVLSQTETTTLGYLTHKPENYSRIRLWGSLGFSVAVVLLGLFFDFFSIEFVPVAIAVFLACNWLMSLTIQEAPPQKNTQHSTGDGGISIAIVAFLLAQSFVQISHGAYYTFYSLYLQDHGYSRFSIGLLWALGVIAEIILFVYMHRIQRRFSVYAILVVSLILTVLRWLVTAFCVDSLALTIFSQTLHAFSFAATHAASIEIIRRYFGHHKQGQGQALYSSMGFGLGGALGALISGYIWSVSATLTFLSSALAAIIALCLVIYASRRLKI